MYRVDRCSAWHSVEDCQQRVGLHGPAARCVAVLMLLKAAGAGAGTKEAKLYRWGFQVNTCAVYGWQTWQTLSAADSRV
jgi:hypothetical protein